MYAVMPSSLRARALNNIVSRLRDTLSVPNTPMTVVIYCLVSIDAYDVSILKDTYACFNKLGDLTLRDTRGRTFLTTASCVIK